MWVLIVDDESSVRSGLLKYINWESLGIDSADAVGTVEEALDFIRAEKPEIIISDIRMPGMNGIELCNAIREVHPSCRIIFLSGYSDKEYLMGAISLSVEAYLEKPVSIQEMEECLRKTVQLCIQDYEKLKREEEFAQYIEDNQDRVQEECIYELTRGRFEHAPLSKLSEENTFVLSEDRYYQCIAMQAARGNGSITQRARDTIERIRNGFRAYEVQILSEVKNSGQMIMILSATKDVLLKTSQLDTGCMREEMRKKIQGDIRIFGTIGRWEKGYGQIVSLYVQACADLQKVFYLGYNKLITENNRKAPCAQEEQEKYDLRPFEEAAVRKDWEKAGLEAEKIYSYYREKTELLPNIVKNVFFHCCLLVSKESEWTDSGLPSEDENRRERDFLWEKINDFETLEDCFRYLRDNINLCAEKKEMLSVNGKVVMDVTDYIRRRFSDPNLSVKEIADRVYLTPPYLSNVFKSRTGKNLIQYIKEVRLEHSVALMDDRSLTLADIAQRCGYSDQNYFAKVFKKKYGMSPSEYRERVGK